MEKLRKNKGITLVALVITIIILLILAGVAIITLTQTELFDKAKQAKNSMENAQNTENIILADYTNKINETVEGTREQQNQQSNITYSEEEEVVGKWIDGKDIYSKMIDMGTNYSVTAKQIKIEEYISNIDFPIKSNIYVIDTVNGIKGFHPCSLWRRASGEWRIGPTEKWEASSTLHIYIYVEYTKN